MSAPEFPFMQFALHLMDFTTTVEKDLTDSGKPGRSEFFYRAMELALDMVLEATRSELGEEACAGLTGGDLGMIYRKNDDDVVATAKALRVRQRGIS
jgi:hypothetical protein